VLPKITGFETDLDSVKEYGQKERVFFLGGTASEVQAIAHARTWLGRVGKPVTKFHTGNEAEPADCWAVVEARGWWETLDWKFYNQPAGETGHLKTGVDRPIGTNASQKLWWNFTISGEYMAEVWVRARRFRAADGLRLELYRDDPRTGSPAVISSVTLAASSLSDSHEWVRFTLPVAMYNFGPQIYGVLSRTGTLSDANYFGVQIDEGLGNVGPDTRIWNGSAWNFPSPNGDICFWAVGVQETTRQLLNLFSAGFCGQFFSERNLLAVSGIQAPQFRDGSRRGRQEAEDLLKAGTSAGARLLAMVDDRRRVHVYLQPGVKESQVMTGRDGVLRAINGRPLLPSQQPAGSWVRLGDVSTAGKLLGHEGAVFAEKTRWAGGKLRIEAE
jgi:hypothetical protein